MFKVFFLNSESSDEQNEQFNEVVSGSRQNLLLNETKKAFYQMLINSDFISKNNRGQDPV